MTLPRRKFMQLAAGAAALPAVSRDTFAADYPTRPVKIIAGFPAPLTDRIALADKQRRRTGFGHDRLSGMLAG
jgi:hypothetical protein